MLRYDEFDDRAETRWLPYLMYFHRAGFRSDVINTDQLGFRISHGPQRTASAGGELPQQPLRLLAGSSTALGIGATSDAATIASRLWTRYAPSLPWLNFAGRSYNSTQELMLFALYHHLLPDIDEIVIFSGLNDLALSRLPQAQRGDHGAFFNCGEYFEQMEELRARHRKGIKSLARRETRGEEAPRPLADRIAGAVEITVRHLESWRLLASRPSSEAQPRITFVLQPLATWVREEHAEQEKLLFGELDQISNFWQLYGDIATKEAGRTYAEALRVACDKLGVRCHDLSPALAEVVTEKDWLYVDRAHFTDHGHDVVSRLLAEILELS
jgi:hypothetical protein